MVKPEENYGLDSDFLVFWVICCFLLHSELEVEEPWKYLVYDWWGWNSLTLVAEDSFFPLFFPLFLYIVYWSFWKDMFRVSINIVQFPIHITILIKILPRLCIAYCTILIIMSHTKKLHQFHKIDNFRIALTHRDRLIEREREILKSCAYCNCCSI